MDFFSLFRVRRVRVRRKLRAPTTLERESARTLVHAKLAHFNTHYGFVYRKVCIKNTRTRWGSCSSTGNLNFNYRIIYLSPEQQDYLIVHELCHLKEFNHGPHFWKLVAEQVPEYKRIRATLHAQSVHIG